MNISQPTFSPDMSGERSIDPATIPDIGDPSRDIRSGGLTAFLFFGLFLGWAAYARLDSGVAAPGSFVVSGELQSVQHRDGGVVSEILVREGQRVVAGQLLIRLAAAAVQAQERALSSQAIRLLAQHARLQAEALGVERVSPPPEFQQLSAADRLEAAKALQLQQAELNARLSVLAAQRAGLSQRMMQAREQGRGYAHQVVSTAEQVRLYEEELEALKPVAARGFVSQTRLRQLERARAEMVGQNGQFSASIAQASGATQENRLRIVEIEQTYRERTTADLRDNEMSLGDVLPKLDAARDQLVRTQIRAPATGAVVGLSVFTPGGVIAPGQKLMNILPERMPLRIQARISPDDADDLKIGQRAMIRLTSLHERAVPDLEGRLTTLSADSLVDERTGQRYFTAELTVPSSQLQSIRSIRGRDFVLRSGMPVDILIPLRKRTALEYLFEPLISAFWTSFREH